MCPFIDSFNGVSLSYMVDSGDTLPESGRQVNSVPEMFREGLKLGVTIKYRGS